MYTILRILLIPITIFYILSILILIPIEKMHIIYSREIPLHFYISFSLALIGLTIAVENFYRKEGHKVQSMLQLTLTFDIEIEPTVTKVTLINLKDKPLIIYGIYIEINPITIIEYQIYTQEEPLIIKPYESHTILKHPVYFYQYGINIISLKKIGIDIKKAKVILKTMVGKIVTQPLKAGWNPTFYQFRLQPKTLTLDNKFISPEIEYVIQFFDDKDKYHVVFIDQRDTQNGFNLLGIMLEEKDFESKEALKVKLDAQILKNEKINRYNLIEPKKEILKNKVLEFYQKNSLPPIVLKKISDFSAYKYKLKMWWNLRKAIKRLKRQFKK